MPSACCVVPGLRGKGHAAVRGKSGYRGIFNMKNSTCVRAIMAALISVSMIGSSTVAWADIKDYEFQLLDQTVKKGDAIISVRLVHKPDGKPVPDAVIFATRLD